MEPIVIMTDARNLEAATLHVVEAATIQASIMSLAAGSNNQPAALAFTHRILQDAAAAVGRNLEQLKRPVEIITGRGES